MARSRKNAGSSPAGDCVIPPPIPTEAIPELLFKRDLESEEAIRDYVEWQAPSEKVLHAEQVTTEYVLGRKVDAWDVRTDTSRWWVITSPTNLYSQELFPSVDYTISFHVGLMARVMSEPDPGVPELEQALMPAAWRRWEQAVEALDEAEEADDFQAVGVRCRECFVAMVKAVARPEMVPDGSKPPERANAVEWCDLIANHVARGKSAEYVRGYLKAISKSGWHLVNWLTHAAEATQADAVLAVELTQHVLGIYGTALLREIRGIPDRCPNCRSCKIGLWASFGGDGADPVPRCQICGSFCTPAANEPLPAAD